MSLDHIVSILGDPARKTDRRWWWCCPFHSENNPSFSVTTDTCWAQCFGCGESMPAHKLVRRLGFPGLAKQLVRTWENRRIRTMENPTPALPEWMAYKFEWDDEVKKAFPTFKESTLQKEGIGYDPSLNRATVPIRDENGHLVGFSGRATFPTTLRYYLYRGKDLGIADYRFAQTRHLWGLHHFYNEAVKTPTTVYVAEGFKQRMRMVEAGFKTTVSLMTRTLSNAQLRLLERVADNIVLALDRDKAGTDSTKYLARESLRAFRSRGKLAYFGFEARQPDHLTPDELWEQKHKIVPIDQLIFGDAKPTPLSKRARVHRKSVARENWR